MKKKKIPMRRCIGCMESKEKHELIRITYYEGKAGIDTTGRAKGRGAYICHNRECLEKAIKKKAFTRAFEAELSKDQLEELKKDLTEILDEER